MKFGKYFLTFLCVIIGIGLVWYNLPLEIKYRTKIQAANRFAQNLQNYRQKYGKFPAENDWHTLARLNPLTPYQAHVPEFKIIDNQHFELTFVQGFDPPYLRYSTRTQKWEIK
ncbi:MAG: hypothetical protein MUE85_16975 [Microscillaceae bacterium]|jgi:hypothetical protein|nr:hypothetical protein [Microscillaceae bacterium]